MAKKAISFSSYNLPLLAVSSSATCPSVDSNTKLLVLTQSEFAVDRKEHYPGLGDSAFLRLASLSGPTCYAHSCYYASQPKPNMCRDECKSQHRSMMPSIDCLECKRTECRQSSQYPHAQSNFPPLISPMALRSPLDQPTDGKAAKDVDCQRRRGKPSGMDRADRRAQSMSTQRPKHSTQCDRQPFFYHDVNSPSL